MAVSQKWENEAKKYTTAWNEIGNLCRGRVRDITRKEEKCERRKCRRAWETENKESAEVLEKWKRNSVEYRTNCYGEKTGVPSTCGLLANPKGPRHALWVFTHMKSNVYFKGDRLEWLLRSPCFFPTVTEYLELFACQQKTRRVKESLKFLNNSIFAISTSRPLPIFPILVSLSFR